VTDLSLDDIIDYLGQYQRYITPDHVSQIKKILRSAEGEDHDAQSESSNALDHLLTEVQEQMAFLKTFRERITARGAGSTTREVKDMIQASSTLFTMLTKLNVEITNQARLRKIEDATVEVIKTLDAERQQQFFSQLEEALKS
jgi:hypothetical protein